MVTAAFPYVNTPLHIGHIRIYGTADVLARYRRMQGFNVLYPMAIHGTGTPVLAFSKRIKQNDQELIDELHQFHVGDEDIKKMVDPKYIIDYFGAKLPPLMKSIGMSIDWRRIFVSIDPFFSKFVEWQFGILNSKGYLVKGKHPVGWCPNENNAVGMHDTQHDVEPEIEEQVAIKFRVDGEEASMICTTYRPETIFGVTNLFVMENAKYMLCKIDGENYYMSKAAAEILSNQMKIEFVKEVDWNELLKKKVLNPINDEKLPVFPGFFVKEDIGTGIVMSVPSHAPFDYAAIERLKEKGYDVGNIAPKKLIDVQIGRSLSDVAVGDAKPEHLDIPALAYLEILHTNVNSIDDMLEFATKLQYREESHWGKMIVKGYEGMGEPEAREKLKSELLNGKKALKLYVLTNAPVKCRCGYNVVVNVVDQWFIDYGNVEWKKLTKDWLDNNMRIIPEKSRNAFNAIVDWIDLRAVARAQGLGTKFPLDKNFIIESLSDSTIYPAFYTISHLIKNVPVDKLTPQFFEYIYHGNGDIDQVAKQTGIDYEMIKRCRESFTYWYKETSRHSAPDLIPNHLTMYIFNHIAAFDKEYWPKQIVINGFVMSEGEKMSKSLGNIIPLVDGVEKVGVDPLRIVELTSADLLSDSEYSEEAVNGVKERLEYLNDLVNKIDTYDSGELSRIDYWLYSKMNRKINIVTGAMDKMELRDAGTSAFYDSIIELKRYFERGGKNGIVLKEFLQNIALMMQPIAPHIAEEFWHSFGNGSFVSLEKWPSADKEMISDKIEREEDYVEMMMQDMKNAIELVTRKNSGKKPSKALLVVASDWKREALNLLVKNRNIGGTIDEMKGKGTTNSEVVAKYLSKYAKDINKLRSVEITQEDEIKALEDARSYIGSNLDVEVSVEKEEQSKSARAERSAPLKPSLDIS